MVYMEIITKNDLCPNLQRYLPKISDDKMFYKEHGIKHPSALYNVSLGKVESAIRDFLDVYVDYKDKDFESVDKENTGKLLKTYRTVLYAVREHLDDCFSIIKIFIKPPQNEKANRNQYRWLELNASAEMQDFFASVRDYKNYIDNVVNELKHNNGILAGVSFYDANDGSQNCLGYFIANVVNGAYSPVEKIHPKFQNVYTGFSFRRDLHYNIFNIYKISEDILIFLKNNAGVDIESLDVDIQEAHDSKKKLFHDLMEMPRFHFPDEYAKSVPSVAITQDRHLRLTYPSYLSIKPNRLNRVILTHSGDGHTREFKIPYI